jgi:hypothetical protein
VLSSAAARENDPGKDGISALHVELAAVINKILSGGNAVRRR